MTGHADVLVVGAGHQGLVAAIRLAEAGRRVVVLERAPHPGGALRSEELIEPGAVHDLYATNIGLFLGSALMRDHAADLRRHGLAVAHTDAAFANAFPGGRHLGVHKGRERTLAGLDPADAEGWLELEALFGRPRRRRGRAVRVGDPVPARRRDVARAWVQGARRRRSDPSDLLRLLLSSTRELGERHLRTPEARSLVACWGMHPDAAPDVAGGAVFPLLECFGAQAGGMAIAAGGASTVVDAMVGYLRELGGEVRLEADVTAVVTRDRAVRGVALANGERLDAPAVVASVTPPAAFGRLIAAEELPASVVREARRYRFGPASFMVHLLLDAPIPWSAPELADFGYVHVVPAADAPTFAGVDALAATFAEVRAGLLPRSPMLCVGQTSVVDPTRAPAGRHVVWIQVRCVPAAVRGDARGELAGAGWDELREPFADRVLGDFEQVAPGVTGRIVGGVAISPADLARANPNLVGGDPLAGSSSLAQMAGLRPFPGMTRYRTPITGFYLCGASTWPGAGLNGVSGELAARRLLTDTRRARRARR